MVSNLKRTRSGIPFLKKRVYSCPSFITYLNILIWNWFIHFVLTEEFILLSVPFKCASKTLESHIGRHLFTGVLPFDLFIRQSIISNICCVFQIFWNISYYCFYCLRFFTIIFIHKPMIIIGGYFFLLLRKILTWNRFLNHAFWIWFHIFGSVKSRMEI